MAAWPAFASGVGYLLVVLATRPLAEPALLDQTLSRRSVWLGSMVGGLPTSIALGCLILFGVRVWPGVAIGSVLGGLLTGMSLPLAATLAVGNTAAPLCGYLLMRCGQFRIDLDRLRDALALVFLGAFAGGLIEATLNGLAATGSGLSQDFWSLWAVVWTGDAMAVLVVVPLMLLLRRARLPRTLSAPRSVEGAGLLLGTLAAALVGTMSSFDVLFLVFPFLIWAALRFQLAGTAPCVAVATVAVVFAAADGTGPFAGEHLYTKLITLQVFCGAAALSALLLAVIISQRNQAQREIEAACNQLVDAMGRLDRVRGGAVPLASLIAQRRGDADSGA
ncbi:MASE1 domain-containing protein [Actinopolymorpha pittospori]